jgi:hydrogenase/urease accessory protein HupE
MKRRTGMRWGLVVGGLVALLGALAPRTASAHEVGLSHGEYTLEGASLQVRLTFARRELLGLLPSLDEDKDGFLSSGDLIAGRGVLKATVRSGLSARTGGEDCHLESQDARLIEEDGVALEAKFSCGRASERATVEVRLLQHLPHGHRHLARATSGETVVDSVLLQSAPLVELGGSAGKGSVAGSMLWMGLIHILGGFDHLVFLFGLILVGGSLRGLIATITAFTVAHSITIALAVLGVWSASPSIIEPAIALSVAYVGIENFFVKSADRRWLITFPFGLVHGFGFAGALGELAVPREQLVPALLSFNLGVEAGQLAVLAVVLPVLLWARQREWFRTYGVRGLSTVVVLLGVGWFALRVMELG